MLSDNATAKARLDLYINELYKVQRALDEGGYLSAFPSEHLDRVEALQQVWAPYYVVGAILCGATISNCDAGCLIRVWTVFNRVKALQQV